MNQSSILDLDTTTARAKTLLQPSKGIETPFLMVSREVVEANVQRWRRSLPTTELFFAVKANNDPLILHYLNSLGCCFDTASAYEMQLVAALGVTGDRMILSHPAKDAATLAAMQKYRPWAFVADKEKEIGRVRQAGVPSGDYAPAVFVRIRADSQNVNANLSEKFGCRPERAVEVLKFSRDAGFQQFGLSFHVGTQCYEASNYRRALTACRKIAADARDSGILVETIDIGGGYCDGRVAQEKNTTHDELFEQIGRDVAELGQGFRLLGEPGRYIVADAGTIIVQVLSEYSSDQTRRRIVIDEHVYGGLSGHWHDGRIFDFIPLRPAGAKPFSPFRSVCTIFGATCDSIDRFDGEGRLTKLPADLDVGDFLLIPCAGAYSNSAGSSFNGLEPAGVIMTWTEGHELRWQLSPFARKNDFLLQMLNASGLGQHALGQP